ncbi:transcriptional regulator [Aquamicrobium sp. LC103]|nr:type IV toxin-antitoxin system AbiEi family antitoxin domain-containing protein [Aquamicrobium sp. LC103]TKT83024.1 transcriptional regulator [Aquamicrobium sp. LC103]
MPKTARPEEVFRAHGGQLRMSEALGQGLSRYTLYALKDRGVIEQISRGVYRLADLPPIGNPDLVTVSLRFPHAVICLVSALSWHGITTQIPHAVSLAIPRDSRSPSLDYPPVLAHQFSEASFKAGIEHHDIDGVQVRIYDAEKSIADCFKFRNRIGMDVVLEALQLYRQRMKFDSGKLLKYAKVCRVENVMRPYVEAIACSPARF